MASETARLHIPPWRICTRLRSRVRTWLNVLELDRELALGAHPRRSAELSLRVERLKLPKTRLQLAKTLRCVVHKARGQSSPHLPAWERRAREQIEANSEALLTLGDRLEAEPPHCIRGVAMVSHLIYDAESPLHVGVEPQALSNAIQAASDALGGS